MWQGQLPSEKWQLAQGRMVGQGPNLTGGCPRAQDPHCQDLLPDSLKFRGEGTIFPVRSGNQHKEEWWAKDQSLQVDVHMRKARMAKAT